MRAIHRARSKFPGKLAQASIVLASILIIAHSSGASASIIVRAQPSMPEATSAATGNNVRAIILFIGDGMGPAQRTAGQWFSKGQSGLLAMDELSVMGRSHTASADSPVTDSAAAGTAIATGYKTNKGVIAMDVNGDPLVTILEQAQAEGFAVGLVTTVQMTHATPATFAAHVTHRSMMTEIASQMIDAQIDLLLGGGEDEFLPTSKSGCYPQLGERSDGRDLIAEAVAAGYTYVCDALSFDAIDPVSTDKLLGLFADEGMSRPYMPSLVEMTQKAIDILSRDPEGFFLMVEGGQIDWAGHANDAIGAIADTVGLDEAVSVARAFALTSPNTLIITTADHETGGMSVSLTSSGLPDEDGPFVLPDSSNFYINWATSGHTAVDVPTTAEGPWSNLLMGTHENTSIHHVMHEALMGATFTDVAPDHWAWAFVEALADAGLAAGYADGTYRPVNPVTRAEMAVFLKKAIHGSAYTPPPPDGSHPFIDIAGHWGETWIEDFYDEGLTSGYPDGSYRPENGVTRAEMAVFLLRANHGSSYTPPAPSGGSFTDVAGHWAEAWIEQLEAEGTTSGYPDGTFKPQNSVTRAEMAVFLTRAFSLTLP